MVDVVGSTSGSREEFEFDRIQLHELQKISVEDGKLVGNKG